MRTLAIRLSGRQVKAKTGWTLPALLVGMGLLVLIWRILADAALLTEVIFLQQHFCPFPTTFSTVGGFV